MSISFINQRARILSHILFMKTLEPKYAEKALKWYAAMLPELKFPSWEELCK